MSLPFLQTFGLTGKEAAIYELLLKIGDVPASKVIKETGYKRATVYKSLYSLEEKGLLTKQDKDKKIHFKPASPTQLTTLAEARIKEIERARTDLSSLLPELESDYILSVEKPVISEFEGKKGIKAVFDDIYGKKSEPVYGCVDLAKTAKELSNYIVKKLIPLRVKNKVMARSLIADSSQARNIARKDNDQLRESVLLDRKRYPFPAEIDVYEDKVAMLSFEKGHFIGLLIKDKAIATSLKSVFKLAFDLGRGQQQKTKNTSKSI